MKKLGILIVLVLSSVCFADMMAGAGAMMAKMAPPQVIILKELKANPDIQDLLTLAETLKMESVTSYSSPTNPSFKRYLISGIEEKIHEDPSWDKKLSISGLPLDALKISLGEKSYVWAWIQKQKGDQPAAKKILSSLYQEGSEAILGMKIINGHDTLTRMKFIQDALVPMSSSTETKQNEAKMQKMKTHVSNLPDMRMLT